MSITRQQSSPGRGGSSRAAADGEGRSLRRPAVYNARQLRRTMPLPEVILWQRLKGSPMGLSFRKQHPIDPYVVDFYCAARKLVIEVEGQAHELGDRPQRDDSRFTFLAHGGYDVLRIAAEDVLSNPDGVAASILAYAATPLHHPADGPPPRPGEEL